MSPDRLGPALVAAVEADPRLRHVGDVVVVHRGEEVFVERRHPGRLRNTFSVTKSIVALLVGLAVETGRCPGPATTVERPDVSLHHLLSMQRGAVCDVADLDVLHRRPGSWRAWIEAMPHDVPPGSQFRYDNCAYELLGRWLADHLGRSVESFAAEVLFGPLGIAEWSWPCDADGYSWTAGELALAAPDLARIGLVLVDGGRGAGRLVVPQDWLTRMTTAHSPGGAPEGLPYGYGVWLGADFHLMGGWAGQHVLAYPGRDLVVVVTGLPELLPDGWLTARPLVERLVAAIPA